MALSDDDVAALVAMGFVEPRNSRWHRMNDSGVGSERDSIWKAEFICWCHDIPKRVSMVPWERESGAINFGQCPFCMEISWCHWRAKVRTWTGQRTLRPAKPMYDGDEKTLRWIALLKFLPPGSTAAVGKAG